MGLTQHFDSQVAISLLPITELSVNFLQDPCSFSPAALEGFSNYAVALLQGSRRNLTARSVISYMAVRCSYFSQLLF